jgi:hypothetical protein
MLPCIIFNQECSALRVFEFNTENMYILATQIKIKIPRFWCVFPCRLVCNSNMPYVIFQKTWIFIGKVVETLTLVDRQRCPRAVLGRIRTISKSD